MRTPGTAAAVVITLILSVAVSSRAYCADPADFVISINVPAGFSQGEPSRREFETAAGIKTQETYLCESDDAVIIISVTDTGFTEETEQGMIEALEYAMMEYSAAYSVLSTGSRRINGNVFVTGRYAFAEDGTDLYAAVFATHIGTKQFQIQLLAYSPDRLDQADLREAVNSFTYLVKNP
jgi:hypothetical protein